MVRRRKYRKHKARRKARKHKGNFRSVMPRHTVCRDYHGRFTSNRGCKI